ncbi:helix-turn-helix transcriptional regulator [Steroidobacter cummioxidans]|uniref:helix-turn-helix transcriptional regulator n=1 Tax=Steroidobacter cummioxidans TaxID=1803913 RepID=UPI000E322374|nr:AraC family transcriptional regulator [Steroidobacter cummioxidans]
MPALLSRTLLESPLVRIRDVQCFACRGRHGGVAECDSVTHIVIPYRGSFVRRVGARVAHADVNQAVFFNVAEEYRIDHLADEGDACVSLEVTDEVLEDLAEGAVRTRSGVVSFAAAQRRIPPALQLQISKLRHSSHNALFAEELACESRRAQRSTAASRRLIDRAKQALHSQPYRRWSLGEIANHVGASPVHLTQTFSDGEGVPLYRYQTQLRLALALHRLPEAKDLASLALDLGFSSHSQFSAAFTKMYGVAPSRHQSQLLKNRTAHS